MNVFEKLQIARVELQNTALKKTGKNKYSKYDYFELGDFLPTINIIFAKHKLFSQVSFTDTQATLKVINTEKPEEVIEFTSPMASADLKGCHPIQNLGAVQTYQRRYLYMTALEIVESDAINAGEPEQPKQPQQKSSKDYKQDYVDTAKKLGFSDDELKILAEKTAELHEKKPVKWADVKDTTFRTLLKQFEDEKAVESAKQFAADFIKEGD